MHTHFSLFEGETNAFHDPGDERGLSKTGQQFIAGLLEHACEITAVTNQWVNSYKRLVAGYEAPVHVSWAYNNRSALVRVPIAKRGKIESTRIEYRSPDPACNPYLAFAVILAAGLRGIEKSYELPPEAAQNLFAMTPEELASEGSARFRQPPRRGRGDGAVRARRRDARRARLRVVHPQQARRMVRVHPTRDAVRARPLPVCALRSPLRADGPAPLLPRSAAGVRCRRRSTAPASRGGRGERR